MLLIELGRKLAPMTVLTEKSIPKKTAIIKIVDLVEPNPMNELLIDLWDNNFDERWNNE